MSAPLTVEKTKVFWQKEFDARAACGTGQTRMRIQSGACPLWMPFLMNCLFPILFQQKQPRSHSMRKMPFGLA